MAEAKRPPLEKLTTPVGTLKYPKLNEPDTKFKDTGVYQTKLVLTADEAAPIVARMEELAKKQLVETTADLEEKIKAAKGEAKGKLKKALAELKIADSPAKPCFDDDGEPNGDIEFNFKMNAQRTDKKTNKVIKMSPKFFDAKGVEIKNIPSVWGGTKARVSAQYVPFYTPVAGCGVALRLSALKIIELVSGGGGTAKDHGFGDEEEGYAADAAAKSESSTAGDDAGSTDGEEEF